jgi:hypothetical protein
MTADSGNRFKKQLSVSGLASGKHCEETAKNSYWIIISGQMIQREKWKVALQQRVLDLDRVN